MSIVINPYLNQYYEDLKYQSIQSGYLFRDDHFSADEQSVSQLTNNNKSYNVYWKRPFEIDPNPQFIVNEIDPNDLVQGDTGNCWFISAVVTLASIPSYCKFVIPDNQSFNRYDYAGIFHFRFWQFGEWIDVVVDDRLPVDENNQLIYCRNQKNKNEFFGPLLEKAYAKLAGCYEFLNYGDPTVAMTDLTGAVCETFDISKTFHKDEFSNNNDEFYDNIDNHQLESLWIFIFKSFLMRSLMGCSFNGKETDVLDEKGVLSNGLEPDHAYSITQVVEFAITEKRKVKQLAWKSNRSSVRSNMSVISGISTKTTNTNISSRYTSKNIRLIKLRNPHANPNSWNGAWSPNSPEWTNLDPEIKKKYNLKLTQPNGEFYMSFKDFVKHFEQLDIAHVNLNAFSDLEHNFVIEDKTKWHLKQLYGDWKKNSNAGGAFENYWNNPQYLLHINQKYQTDAKENLENQSEEITSLIIALMQPYSSETRVETNGKFSNLFQPIKFHLYSVKDKKDAHRHVKKRKKFNENQLKLINSSGPYSDQREVTKRCYLTPGYYVILPSTLEENFQMEYLLRIFHDKFSCDLITELS